MEASRTADAGVPSGREADADPLPQVVYIELADYCNLNCTFCGRAREIETIRGGDKGGFIAVETLKMLERPLRAAGYLGLSGRIGEPLLHPRLASILAWVFGINPAIRLRITTNGTALSRKMAELLGGHLDWLAISLNASNADAYFREMRPVGQKGANKQAWWDNLRRRIAEFIAALPQGDRGRIRIIAPAHRDNIDGMFDFVRLVADLGCAHAVVTPMQFHDAGEIGASIYWMKDKYNDVLDAAAAMGARLGVKVEAARFYTNPKAEQVDLDQLCREPIDTAYLNMEAFGGATPCCHWIDDLFPADIYRDAAGFERFWNAESYRRLRRKRDSASCKSCGLTRSFDEIAFHVTPLLKKTRRAAARPEATDDGYPDAALVGVCRNLALDLRSLRRTVLGLGLPVERLNPIAEVGLAALPDIDRACWDAFRRGDPPAAEVDLALGGCFLGIGWFDPDNDPAARLAARWMGGARRASVYVRVAPGASYRLLLTAHHLGVADMADWLYATVCDETLAVERRLSGDGSARLVAAIPRELADRHAGRLRIGITYNNLYGVDFWPSFGRLEIVRVGADRA
jgi:MoaA/NifB/PqqE/SkfB family radical SAM enzyme